jgi:hypothetical protein
MSHQPEMTPEGPSRLNQKNNLWMMLGFFPWNETGKTSDFVHFLPNAEIVTLLMNCKRGIW